MSNEDAFNKYYIKKKSINALIDASNTINVENKCRKTPD